MSDRVIQIVMEDGSSLNYEEKNIDHFRKKFISENAAKTHFYNQHSDWERNVLSYFSLDIESFAKQEYDLIDADEKKDINDFDDSDILDEAESRGILPVSVDLENSNILNEGFIDRFVKIINRGNNAEIENTLDFLEFKYKI